MPLASWPIQMFRLAAVIVLLLSTACSVATKDAPNTCAEATLDVEECLNSAKNGEIDPGECQVWIEDAGALCSAGKADGWGASLCSLGVLHYCEAPICDIPSVADGDECSGYMDDEGCASCDYYLCKEAADGAAACGEDGYYLGYGFRYCERISQVTRPRLSDAGKVWLDSARRCLMEEVELQVEHEHSCSDIQQIAFDSHPACYMDAGFCSLPWGDMWSVFMTVDPTDVEMRQVFSTGIGCFRDFF